MKVIRPGDIPEEVSTAPVFRGTVNRMNLVSGDDSQGSRLTQYRFSPGSKTVWHTHTFDQILLVTDGKGVLANEKESNVVTVGCIIHVPPGEKHWHGATDDSYFSHIGITTDGTTDLLEEVTG